MSFYSVLKMYSTYHLIYVVLFAVILAAAVVVFKFALKSYKARDVFIRCLGGLLTVSLIANRITLTVWDNNGIGIREMIPNTYCGMSSLLLGIFAMIGKPNAKIFHFLFYLEMIGGTACVFYPTFINQNPSFFFPPTITGMNHHACGVILCVILVLGKRFEPSFENRYVFPIGIAAYTLFGLFLIDALKIPNTMLIDEPAVAGTPINWWFVLIFGSAVEIAFTFVYDRIKKKRAAKNDAKEETENDRA